MLAISILVHESPDVVLDQLKNVKKFIENCEVILHINRNSLSSFKLSMHWNEIKSLSLVNPNSLIVGRHDLIQAHNENFYFAKRQLGNFSHFCLHASNDMFIKNGVEKYVANNECGFHNLEVHPNMGWSVESRMRHDPQFKLMCEHACVETIMGSQLEGSFYSKDLFDGMLKVIEKFFNRSEISSYMTKSSSDMNNTLYAREELYYPTLAYKFCKKSAYPYLYSEVNASFRNGNAISIEAVKSIVENTIEEKDCFDVTRYKGKQLYDKSNLYAVKRVPRNYDDSLRSYIRNLKS